MRIFHVKHKVRYFFSQAIGYKSRQSSENAYRILVELGKTTNSLDLLTILPKATLIYRSRQHKKEEVIKYAKQMSSPPDELAIYPNRMSPAGISMFYGSFDLLTCQEETKDIKENHKPKLSSAKFETLFDLNIIDFSKVPKLPSIFDQNNVDNIYLINFLHDFIKDFSGPVKRDGLEHIDYVSTQIVTEYFRFSFPSTYKKKVDGIIYPSSKIQGKKSIVLFMDHKESLENLSFIKSSLLTIDIEFSTNGFVK